MKPKVLIPVVTAVLVIAAAAFFYLRHADSGGAAGLRPAPRFALKDAVGKEHRLEELKGNLVVIHFWASWCPPCLEEIGEFKEAAVRYQDRPIKWVAISVDQKWEDAHRILPAAGLPPNFLSLLDPAVKTPDQYGTYQYPETYLLDRELRVAAKWVGAKDWASPELKIVFDSVQ